MINTYQTTLSKKKELHHDIYHLTFSLKQGQTLEFTAGQYLIVFVPQADGSNLRRLYSILSSTISQNSFELLAEIIPGGAASEYFKKLKVGDTVTFQGPAGMFKLKDTIKPTVFLATGTGIAPILSMIDELLYVQKRTIPITLFWGLKKQEHIYMLDVLKEYAKKFSTFTFYICLSREEKLLDDPCYIQGRINVGFEKKIKDIHENTYYICGGREVTESLRQYLYEKGIQKEDVVFEKF